MNIWINIYIYIYVGAKEILVALPVFLWSDENLDPFCETWCWQASDFMCPKERRYFQGGKLQHLAWQSLISCAQRHGSLNVPIEHHPTIRYMVYNGYYKVMSNIPKMGQLPTPERSAVTFKVENFSTWHGNHYIVMVVMPNHLPLPHYAFSNNLLSSQPHRHRPRNTASAFQASTTLAGTGVGTGLKRVKRVNLASRWSPWRRRTESAAALWLQAPFWAPRPGRSPRPLNMLKRCVNWRISQAKRRRSKDIPNGCSALHTAPAVWAPGQIRSRRSAGWFLDNWQQVFINFDGFNMFQSVTICFNIPKGSKSEIPTSALLAAPGGSQSRSQQRPLDRRKSPWCAGNHSLDLTGPWLAELKTTWTS